MEEKHAKNRRTYVCTGCGTCCKWGGYVRINGDEAEAIAEFLELKFEDFLNRFTELTSDRRSLSLIERDDGGCILLSEDGRCLIHAVKPRQCRDFPNKWNFPDWQTLCQAKLVEVAEDSAAQH